MTPKETAAFLRKYNEWRRGDPEDNRESEMPHPREIGVAIDTAIQLIEHRDELLASLEAMVSVARLTIGWHCTPKNANGPLVVAERLLARALEGESCP